MSRYKALPEERNLSKFDIRRGYAFTRTSVLAVPASYQAAGSEPIICKSGEVALIDEIEIAMVSNDGNTNATLTLRVNGIDVPIHFPGTADLVRTERLVWRPRGNLVIHPGQTLAVKAAVALTAQVFIRFRKKGLTQAIADGDIAGGGGLPNVASTNTVAGSGTVADTAKAIIPAVSGKSVEILAMLFTGHSYNAAADNVRLGFWDGTTGSFAANGSTIARAWRQGATARYAQPLIIGNTDGCIQGPAGSGVYIQATTNLANATSPADWVVVYRYIPENRITVVSTSGALGATATTRGKFWVNCETAVTSSILDAQTDAFFAASVGNDMLVKIKGWVQSATGIDDATVNPTIGFGLGSGVATNGGVVATFALGGMLTFGGNAAGTPANCGILFGQDDTLMMANMSRRPAFFGYHVLAGIVNRSQLAWGRIEGDTLESQDTTGRSQFTYIV